MPSYYRSTVILGLHDTTVIL